MKKRRLHLVNEEDEEMTRLQLIDEDEMKKILRLSKEGLKYQREEICYPSTQMLNITDIIDSSSNYVKTVAERKAYLTDDYYILPRNYTEEYFFS